MYLSGREEDVMRHLYGDQASEVMRRTISQRAQQPGNVWGNPDGGDDPQGGDGGDDGDNGVPNRDNDNRNLGRNLPNRRNTNRGGGRPPHGPPGPPGGPPSNSSYHPSEYGSAMAEMNQDRTRDSQRTDGNQGRQSQYLRGYTPGNNRYTGFTMQ